MLQSFSLENSSSTYSTQLSFMKQKKKEEEERKREEKVKEEEEESKRGNLREII